MDIADALALLSKDCSDMQEVRCHAVAILEKATNEDLQLYLLQLVQALRYEPIGQDDGKVPSAVTEFNPPPPSGSLQAAEVPAVAESSLGPHHHLCALMWFLIRRAMCSQTLATLFYWCLVAETADGEKGPLFERARQHLLKAMEDSSEGQAIRNMLDSQVALRHKLLWCVQSAKANKHFRFEHMTQYFRDELSQEQPALDDGRPLCPLNIVEQRSYTMRNFMLGVCMPHRV